MLHKYLEIASTPAVKEARRRHGSAGHYERIDGTRDPSSPAAYDRIGDDEAAFIAESDGFYLASVSETGWPYIQHRGGAPGFLRVLDERTLAFADFRGNRQYISVGNLAGSDKVALFLMDYAHRRRLKIFGRARLVETAEDAALAASLAVPGYKASVERAVVIAVEGFDWNCPQHITPRFTEAELAEALAPVREEIETLRAENARLRGLANKP